MFQIVTIIGADHPQSTNHRLASYLSKRFENEAHFPFYPLEELPPFSKDLLEENTPQVEGFRNAILEADAVLFVTPEYDHSVPALLLNALEWLAFEPYPLLEKPTMIVGASYGNLGTSRAQDHLLDVLRAPQLQAAVQADAGFLLSRSREAFDDKGDLVQPQVREKLDQKMNDFLYFVKISTQNPHLRRKTIDQVRTYRYQSEK
ncbi:NADPH-dependent FMN reductase [Streptococcus sp. DD13]|uniref:NADPH-dependent FMN reductase n=1 Tax=Streptococcus sp. DD13 TaxID=1777881 RepID=UPI000796C50E|nr:NADPH-dependent FMN reductase [Streptococcus sp. DD13]KXT77330.1 Fumarate reductase, flavoprotein subunit precursor [Streptococcus sp. DD13]